ncbi:ADP-ribosylation factor-like protein 5 [Gossypium australe]|uniref:ADP-ribosylation factor-like protein 5 n=1 Tax=Gossypium australe TaxID=47621 RepID=A0A5B6WFV8_9ROSI|nr:ADP-ribosylation factor-like protein 5 [Gossypium australe]
MLFSIKEYKIVVVGLDNAGKMKSLYKLHLGDVITTHPPISSNVEGLVYKNIRFETYYHGTHAVIVVMDCTDRARITLIKDELFRLLRHEDRQHSVILFFANKQDIKDAKTLAEITDALSLRCI